MPPANPKTEAHATEAFSMDSIAHRITKNAILGGRRRTGQSCRYNKTILWPSDESWTCLVTNYPTEIHLKSNNSSFSSSSTFFSIPVTECWHPRKPIYRVWRAKHEVRETTVFRQINTHKYTCPVCLLHKPVTAKPIHRRGTEIFKG